MKSAWTRAAALAGCLAGAAAGGCRRAPPPEEPVRTSRLSVPGKVVQVSVPAAEADRHGMANGVLIANARRLDGLFNVLQPASEISRLNRYGMSRVFPVSRDTYRLIALAKTYSERTGGAFDITVAPLLFAWGFSGGTTPEKPLDEAYLRAARGGVGSHNLDLFSSRISFHTPMTRVHLGELQFGYTVDLTVIELRARDVINVLVDAGNIARGLGQPAPGQRWSVPVVHPFAPEENLGTLFLDQELGFARATRNDRNVFIEGRRYSYFIDPRTGRPAEGTAAVYVLAPSATEATALAHALFVLGLEEKDTALPNFERAEVMIIPDRQPLEIHATAGFTDRLNLREPFAAAVRPLR